MAWLVVRRVVEQDFVTSPEARSLTMMSGILVAIDVGNRDIRRATPAASVSGV